MPEDLPVGVVSRLRAVGASFVFPNTAHEVADGDEIDVFVVPVTETTEHDEHGHDNIVFRRGAAPEGFAGVVLPEGQPVPVGLELVTTPPKPTPPPAAAPASPPAADPANPLP